MRYAFFEKQFIYFLSRSASRMISAVPFSKLNDISPHSLSLSGKQDGCWLRMPRQLADILLQGRITVVFL